MLRDRLRVLYCIVFDIRSASIKGMERSARRRGVCDCCKLAAAGKVN